MLMIFVLGVGEGCITRRRGGWGITAKSLLQTGIGVFVLVKLVGIKDGPGPMRQHRNRDLTADLSERTAADAE